MGFPLRYSWVCRRWYVLLHHHRSILGKSELELRTPLLVQHLHLQKLLCLKQKITSIPISFVFYNSFHVLLNLHFLYPSL